MIGSQIDSNVISKVNQQEKVQVKGSASEELSSNFMTLLITQLQNQDPLNPLENAELTSQLAQINTVSGIENLNKTMTSITDQINASQQMQATVLINRGVLVPGDRVLVGENGASTPFGIELDYPADQVMVTMLDGSGAVIREFDLGSVKAGTESFNWDGKLADGSFAPEGAYRIRVEATNGGQHIPVNSLHYGLVQGVSTTDDGIMLDLGGAYGRVPLTDIRQVI